MIVPIQVGGSGPPLILIHGSGGDVEVFQELIRQLGARRPIYGIVSQALDPAPRALVRIEDLAGHYLRELRSQNIHSPLSLLGHSFGGVVAYEMARQLVSRGESVEFLGMMDTGSPGLDAARTPETLGTRLTRYKKRARYHLRRMFFGPQRLAWFRETSGRRLLFFLYRRVARRTGSIPSWMVFVDDVHLFASSNYKPGRYPASVTLFRAKDEKPDDKWREKWGWNGLVHVRIREISGTHKDLVGEQGANRIAEVINERRPPRKSQPALAWSSSKWELSKHTSRA